jgi:hypothetical protein
MHNAHSQLWIVLIEAHAAPAPDPSTTPATNDLPITNVAGDRALWFIGIVAGIVALLWAVPLFYDTWEANRWRRDRQALLIESMIKRVERPSVEEIRQMASAIDTQPRGARGLTQSLLSLIIATFIGVALIATLVSTATDSGEVRKTIVTALLSILATISGFYFGARTSENATEQARRPPETRAGTVGGGNGTPLAGGPAVAKVDPDSGPPGGGTTVTITGSGFTGVDGVRFGPDPAADVTVRSNTQVTATSPAGSGTVDVVVTRGNETSQPGPAARFRYTDQAP